MRTCINDRLIVSCLVSVFFCLFFTVCAASRCMPLRSLDALWVLLVSVVHTCVVVSSFFFSDELLVL